MAEQSRATLYNVFRDGSLPTGSDFVDLVDSMLNMRDEGFRKTPERGLHVVSRVGSDALLSLYREQDGQLPRWSLEHGQDNRLDFHSAQTASRGDTERPDLRPVLTLDPAHRGGIGTATPQHELDVAGVVASEGRVGTTALAGALWADGEWHTVLKDLTGCHAYEVMAGVGLRGQGRYAMLHALAMNAYNPNPGWFGFLSRRRRIDCRHAWYGRRCDRLELAWHSPDGGRRYDLRIRTRCHYGDEVPIQLHLTSLWHDDMAGAPQPVAPPIERAARS